MTFDLHMHVPCESMLKDALLKAEAVSNAKYFRVLLSFFRIKSLSGNLVHNFRKSLGRGELQKRRKKKRSVILN